MTSPLSVVILAKDEEAFIGRVLDSVSWATERLVVDSGSTDRTRAVAESRGARVVDMPWQGWTDQHRAAQDVAAHDWLLFLDADEIVTPELAASIQAALARDPDPRTGFAVDRRGDFLGILLPNESRRKKRRAFIRMYHRQHGFWDPDLAVHEEVRVPGPVIALSGVLLHWRGHRMDSYVPAFDSYSRVEAQALWDQGQRASGLVVAARPVLRFGWLYVIRGDWRLGTRGLVHSLLKAFQEFLRYARLWEMEHVPAPVVDPPAGSTRERVEK